MNKQKARELRALCKGEEEYKVAKKLYKKFNSVERQKFWEEVRK